MAKGNGASRSESPGRFSVYETKTGTWNALSYEVSQGDWSPVYRYVDRGMGINAALRGDDYRNKEEFLEVADKLDDILSKSTIGKDTTLFRGDNYEAFRRMFGTEINEQTLPTLIGKVGSKKDFTSTYASRGADGAQVQFIIQMPGNKKGGLYLPPLTKARGNSDYLAENEVLLNRGLNFKITKAYQGEGKTRTGGNRYIVHLKVI